MHRRTRGYTLYELLVTTGLIAVLLAVGIPSFASIAARQRQSAEINALFHAIHVARKESIMRRKVVSLCPSHDGLGCANSTDWSSGWLMFEDSDRDSPPSVDAGEPVLQRHAVASDINIQANRRSFTLRATFLRATNGTFIVCDRGGRIPAKGLIISYTGRPRVALSRTSGKPFSCAH